MHPPVNDNFMELLLTISALKRSAAQNVTAVIPYYGYARQDRLTTPGTTISAAEVARLIKCAGADRVVTVDLHCGQLQGFFSIECPVISLYGAREAVDHFASSELGLENPVVCSPDAGGVERAKRFKEEMKRKGRTASFAMVIKERQRANEVREVDLVGDVSGADVIIVDDLIDTAGTLCKAASELKSRGAKRVFAFATHGLLSRDAPEKIARSALEQVVLLDTIPQRDSCSRCSKIVSLSSSRLVADALDSLHNCRDISHLL